MKSFTIWKNEYKKEDKQPDYVLKSKIENTSVIVGKGWKKTSPDGTGYISVQLQDAYNDKSGFRLIEERPGSSEQGDMLTQVADDLGF